MKLAILYGGKSGEHEVSIMSAHSIIQALPPEHTLTLIGISKRGTWHMQPRVVLENARDDKLELREDAPLVLALPGKGLNVLGAHGLVDMQLDAVFPVLHGTFGEDGTVQGLLECCGLPYVGSDVLGSAVAMDKETAKALWKQAGLPVVLCLAVRADILKSGMETLTRRVNTDFGWPVFVKPAGCGSSVGGSKVHDKTQLKAALKTALGFDSKALIEPFMNARELECSVLGNEKARAFPPGELIPTHEFYDYDAKYTDPHGADFIIPAALEEKKMREIMDLAVAAYKAASLSGMARVDFFMDKKSGAVYLNEANTIPGFTSISMYPKMCERAGLSYAELIDELLSLAVDRHKRRAALQYEVPRQ